MAGRTGGTQTVGVHFIDRRQVFTVHKPRGLGGMMITTGALRMGQDASQQMGLLVRSCLRRVCHWPAPPNWTNAEWRREMAAHGDAAAHEASCEYDSTRGTAAAVFVMSRVMGRLLTRYRQEWNFACRMGNWTIESEELLPTHRVAKEHTEVRQSVLAALEQLRETDRWLIVQIFWHDRDQTELARELGISQPAVSKRYHTIVRKLRCFLFER